MSQKNDEMQSLSTVATEKPLYVKPEVVATYNEPDLEKEFAHVYGESFVDLFGG